MNNPATKFRAYLSGSGLALATRRCYLSDVRLYLSFCAERSLDPYELNENVSPWLDSRFAAGESQRILKRRVMGVRKFWDMLVDMGEISGTTFTNPFCHPASKEFARTISEEEVERLLKRPQSENIKEWRDYALVLIAYYLRKASLEDLCRITWKDTDLRAGTLRWKSAARMMEIKCGGDMLSALRGYRSVRKHRIKDGEPVFGLSQAVLSEYEAAKAILAFGERRRVQGLTIDGLRSARLLQLVSEGTKGAIKEAFGLEKVTSKELPKGITADERLRRVLERCHPRQ